MSRSKKFSVTVWCPSYEYQDGGVQQFSRLLVQALKSSPLVIQTRIVALHKSRLGKTRFIFNAILNLIIQKPNLVIITHLHLARISFLLRFLNIPYWICAHGIEVWSPNVHFFKKSLRLASKILCVSRYTQDQLKKILPHQNLKTIIFPNHIQEPTQTTLTKTQAREALDLKLSQVEFLILTVARLASTEAYKGHRQMLHALLALNKSTTQAHYLILGDGDDRLALEKLTHALGLEQRVTFLGRVDDQTLELAYTACDAFAMPSTGEGFGIVYLEALARGRPVLAGNRDGSTDPLMDGALGILVDPLDQTSLIQGLKKLFLLVEQSKPEELKIAVHSNFGFHLLQQRLDIILKHQLSCAE